MCDRVYAPQYASPTKFGRITCLDYYLPPPFVRACLLVLYLLYLVRRTLAPGIILSEIRPAYRAGSFQLQPRSYALEVEIVTVMALQLDHKGVLIVQELLGAYGSRVIWLQALIRYPLQHV